MSPRLFLCALLGYGALAQGPNFVFFLIDDMGHGDTNFNGAVYSTPSLNALKNEGLYFSNYYVEPRCTPSRSALMSGRYPHEVGTQQVFQPGWNSTLPRELVTLPQQLKQSGYNTHLVGKWHLGYLDTTDTPIHRGYDSFTGIHQAGGDYYTHMTAYARGATTYRGYDFWKNTSVFDLRNHANATEKYSTFVYAEEVKRLLMTKTSNDQFFLMVSFQTIHVPYDAPPVTYAECNALSRQPLQNFCNMMRYMDQSVGEIVDLLKSRNLWNNTYVVVSTDNGGYTFEQTGESSNLPFRGGKSTVYEGGIHGVGLVSGGLVASSRINQTDARIFHIMDWYSTIVDLASGSPPAPSSGGGGTLNSVSQKCVIANNCVSDPRNKVGDQLFVGIGKNNVGVNNGAVLEVVSGGNVWKLVKGSQSISGYSSHQVGSSVTPSPTTTFDPTLNLQLFDLTTDPNEQTMVTTNNALRNSLRNAINNLVVVDSVQSIAQSSEYDYRGTPVYNDGIWKPIFDNGSYIPNPNICDGGNDWFYEESFTTDGQQRVRRHILSNGCPNHPWEAINPNGPLKSNNTLTVFAEPCIADQPYNITCVSGMVGKAFNGVVLFSQWANDLCEDAVVLEGETFGRCSGHAGPSGKYHYHIPPSCLLADLGNQAGSHSPQIGWAEDGLPVHGPQGVNGDLILPCSNPSSNPSDCVDECNGHWHRAGDFEYHYHMLGPIGDGVTSPVHPRPNTTYWPYYPKCLIGVVARPSVGQTCVTKNLTVSGYTPKLFNPLANVSSTTSLPLRIGGSATTIAPAIQSPTTTSDAPMTAASWIFLLLVTWPCV